MATISPDGQGPSSPEGQQREGKECVSKGHGECVATATPETDETTVSEPVTEIPTLPLTTGDTLDIIKDAVDDLDIVNTVVTVVDEPTTLLPALEKSSLPRLRKGRWQRLPKGVRILLGILAVLLVLGGGGASAGYYYYMTNIQKPLKQFIRPVSRGANEAKPTVVPAPAYDVIKGRSWNILLLGSDDDNKYVFPQVLTQVMMVVHVDTVNNTVTMVSIPRDSWVPVAGSDGMHKIDQAFLLGAQSSNSFEDGVRIARETVEQDYGITIDNYAWVGLDGFAKVIDTLGGVDIDVSHPMVDDDYPNDTGNGSNPDNPQAYTRLYLAPGPQHLNGQMALEYVRTRHSDLVGDLGRTQRQQQVLEALKLKLNVSSVVTNLPQLLTDLTGSVYTDLDESQMLAFANFARTLQGKDITNLTLGTGTGAADYGDLATVNDPSMGGIQQDVIIPHCAAIQPVMNRIFQLGDSTQSCHIGS